MGGKSALKILLDSNVLFPAWLYPQGVCAKAFVKALGDSRFSVVVCTYSAEELLNVCNRKHPGRMAEIQSFMSEIFLKVKLVATPPDSEKIPEEELVRDVKDHPILCAAVAAGVDVVVTGDKDLIEAGLTSVKVVHPADFIALDLRA